MRRAPAEFAQSDPDPDLEPRRRNRSHGPPPIVRPPPALGARARSLSATPLDRTEVSSHAHTTSVRGDSDDHHDHDHGDDEQRPRQHQRAPRVVGLAVRAAPAPIPLRTMTASARFPRGLRRLRDRLQIQEDGLRLDVNALRQEIENLNVQRLVLNTKSAVQRRLLLQTSVEVVVEYFGAFQHGWILESAIADQQIAELQASLAARGGDEDSRALAMVRTPRQDREQAAFLRERQRLLMDRQQHFVATALDPTLVCGPLDHDGVDAFVRLWKKYSALHGLPRLALTCMTCHGSANEPIVIALGTFSGTLTLKALQEAFPSAMADPRFVKRLAGAAIRYPSREIFHFGQTGLITKYDCGLDYVQAFASLLGNLEDVAAVLAGATLWDDDEGDARLQDSAASTVREGGLIPTTMAMYDDEVMNVRL